LTLFLIGQDIRIVKIGKGRTLSSMLEKGEIDALFSARIPLCCIKGSPNVRRLFEDYVTVEKRYFEKTRVFPIMHVIVIRRGVYEEYPWIAVSLYKAFLRAKEIAYQKMYDKYGAGALKYMLPWMTHEIEETRRLMGVTIGRTGSRQIMRPSRCP